MSQKLNFTLLICLFCFLGSSTLIQAQNTPCAIDGGAPIIDFSETTASDCETNPFESITLGSLPSYDIVVLTPEMTITDSTDGTIYQGEFIAGVTHNGVFNICMIDSIGDLIYTINSIGGLPVDASTDINEYTLTPFAYDQEELDAFVTEWGPTISILLGVTLTVSADLSEIFDAVAVIAGPLTIADFEEAICVTLPSLLPLAPLQYAIGNGQVVGIEDEVINNHFAINSIAPVPATDYVNISLNAAPTDQNFEVIIFDVTGKVIDNQIIEEVNFRLDITNYYTGVYFISVNNGTKTFTDRFYKR